MNKEKSFVIVYYFFKNLDELRLPPLRDPPPDLPDDLLLEEDRDIPELLLEDPDDLL